MSGDLRIDQVLAGALQAREGIRLIGFHKAAVANDVSGKYRRKPALHGSFRRWATVSMIKEYRFGA
ncbi:hypothetical protein MesoLjLa_40710 [Mesorhizobium sp. L-2-11]|nr:hypothetical protein MesoLjLa_40710 [Mesorhizobium sp. L-2-11]